MAKTLLMVVVLLLAVVGRSSAELSAEKQKTCEKEFEKLLACQPYAQKSASEPTTECCKSVSDIRNADPACLCHLLATILKGDSRFKSFNIDGSRMLQLPTVCKTPNANITECPTLLNLSPSSPDYALFNSSGASSKGSTTTSVTSPSSDAYMLQVPFSSFAIYAVFVAVFFIIFPTWP